MCTRKTDQEIAPFITNEDVRIDEHSNIYAHRVMAIACTPYVLLKLQNPGK